MFQSAKYKIFCDKSLQTNLLSPKPVQTKPKINITELNNKIKMYEGVCNTSSFKNEDTKLEFTCKYKHTFWCSMKDILNNVWCTECKYRDLPIEICRLHMERIFETKFPQTNEEWFRFDGYSKDLKIGFMYKGQSYADLLNYHYKDVEDKLIEMKVQDMTQQIYNVENNVTLCKKNGVTLIDVPYTIPFIHLENYIREKLKNYSHISSLIKSIPVGYNQTHFPKLIDHNLERLKLIAYELDGECLSQTYLTEKSKMIFKCEHNVIFEKMAKEIKEKSRLWCPCKMPKTAKKCVYVVVNKKGTEKICNKGVCKESYSKKYCLAHLSEETPLLDLTNNEFPEIAFV